VYKKRYDDPIFLSILYRELKNIGKQRSQSNEPFNIQDLTDLVNGIREIHLLNVDE
jgi:hypothetical protein